MQRDDWHLDKTVSLGHVLTTVIIALSLVAGYAQMSARMAVLENQQQEISDRILRLLESQRGVDKRQDEEIVQLRRDNREDLQAINNKLDRLIQRGSAN